MKGVQPGVLASVPRLARYLTFSLKSGSEPRPALQSLCEVADGEHTVVGLGPSLVLALGCHIAGLRTFPHFVGQGFEVPSTSSALWCWLRGDDRGELVHRARSLQRSVSPAFHLEKVIDAFQYGPSLDLTGYEDGTENPKGEKAAEVAIVRSQSEGLDGSSFVAVQQWVHDLDQFESMSAEHQDNTIGRRKSTSPDADRSAAFSRVFKGAGDARSYTARAVRLPPAAAPCHVGSDSWSVHALW